MLTYLKGISLRIYYTSGKRQSEICRFPLLFMQGLLTVRLRVKSYHSPSLRIHSLA